MNYKIKIGMKNLSFRRGFVSGFIVASLLFLAMILSNTCFGQDVKRYEITAGYFNSYECSGQVEMYYNDTVVSISQEETFEYEYKVKYIEETCGTTIFHTYSDDISIVIVHSMDMLMFKINKPMYTLWFEAVNWDTYLKAQNNE